MKLMKPVAKMTNKTAKNNFIGETAGRYRYLYDLGQAEDKSVPRADTFVRYPAARPALVTRPNSGDVVAYPVSIRP